MAVSPEIIAAYLLARAERDQVAIDEQKLEKLLVTAHGWHLALTGRPLLDRPVVSGEFGPIVGVFPGTASLAGYGITMDIDPGLKVSPDRIKIEPRFGAVPRRTKYYASPKRFQLKESSDGTFQLVAAKDRNEKYDAGEKVRKAFRIYPFDELRKRSSLRKHQGRIDLAPETRSILDRVWETHSRLSGEELSSRLQNREMPWASKQKYSVISNEELRGYFHGLSRKPTIV